MNRLYNVLIFFIHKCILLYITVICYYIYKCDTHEIQRKSRELCG